MMEKEIEYELAISNPNKDSFINIIHHGNTPSYVTYRKGQTKISYQELDDVIFFVENYKEEEVKPESFGHLPSDYTLTIYSPEVAVIDHCLLKNINVSEFSVSEDYAILSFDNLISLRLFVINYADIIVVEE